MIIFAHRGASSDYPENTMLAFEHGINVGANGLELDVHKTKDNKLVVIHDEDIQRTFLGKGLVKDYILDELREFNCRKFPFRENDKCKILTLEEVLILIKDLSNFTLNIELKTDVIEYDNIENDVIEMLEKYNMCNNTIISSFNHESLKRCKSINPNIRIGALYHYKIDNIVEYAKSLNAYAIHPYIELVSKELIDECHRNNIKVNTYTVNDPSIMKMLIKGGIDGVFTDYPELLIEIYKEQ